MTICIKYTKTTAAMITRHRRNPNNNWKIFKTKPSVAVIFEALRACSVKTPDVRMSDKSHLTVFFFH